MTEDVDTLLGHGPSGEPVGLLYLRNESLRVVLTNYGARMLAIEAPDRDGRFDHVLLGFDRVDMILKAGSFGAVLGRYANRIAAGRFSLEGVTYQLPCNDGNNTLHGGKQAFAKKFWAVAARTESSVTFILHSPDGDQGFPGALDVVATYSLEGNALRLRLEGATTKPTPVNLSAHPYFNLGGAGALDVCDHTLEVAASHYLPTDAEQIPTGERRAVEGGPFDFRKPALIGPRIRGEDPQLLFARGYDHHFILDGEDGVMRFACRLLHPASGRGLEIETDRAGLQVYTGNSLNGSLVGHGGTYRQTAGLALEAQAYPDAPNRPDFPSTILRPGDAFDATIIYRFTLV